MNETVESFGNEYYEELWYSIYPDGANWENLFYMAQDPEIMEWCEQEYIKICTLYMQHKAQPCQPATPATPCLGPRCERSRRG